MKEIETLSLMHIACAQLYFKIPLLLIHRERSGDYFDFTYRLISQKVATETLIFFWFCSFFLRLGRVWAKLPKETQTVMDQPIFNQYSLIYPQKTSKNLNFLTFSGLKKWNIGWNWIKYLWKIILKWILRYCFSLLFKLQNSIFITIWTNKWIFLNLLAYR